MKRIPLLRAKARIGILGTGAWGTAMSKILAQKGHRVELWCHEEEVAAEINRRRANSRYLIGVELPEQIHAVTDPLEAAEDYLPGIYKGRLVFVSGPSHAEEVARGKITGLISAAAKNVIAIAFGMLDALAEFSEHFGDNTESLLLERYADIEEVIRALPVIGYIAEEVSAARYVYRLGRQYNLSLPICTGVYRVLNRETGPLEEVERILASITS